MNDQQYPEWQKAAREAQVAILADIQREQDEREAAQQRKQAAENEALANDLAKALTMLGFAGGLSIVGPEVVLSGGYIVSLPQRIGTFKKRFDDETIYTSFTLMIKRLAFNSTEDGEPVGIYGTANEKFNLAGGQATAHDLAIIADLVDKVDRDVENLCRSNDRYLRDQERMSSISEDRISGVVEKSETTGAALESLIRRIVREEQGYYEF